MCCSWRKTNRLDPPACLLFMFDFPLNYLLCCFPLLQSPSLPSSGDWSICSTLYVDSVLCLLACCLEPVAVTLLIFPLSLSLSVGRIWPTIHFSTGPSSEFLPLSLSPSLLLPPYSSLCPLPPPHFSPPPPSPFFFLYNPILSTVSVPPCPSS